MSRQDDALFGDKRGLTVEVKGNNIDGALRLLKKRMTQEGLFREMKRVTEYEKPSERRRREKAEARRRLLKKQAQLREI